MSVEVGTVLPGKVTGITNFGAFIDMGNRRTGLVHISEVSNSYVKDIKDVLTVGDEVQVKVVSVADDGKISLSIRQAQPQEVSEAKETTTKVESSAHHSHEQRKSATSSSYGKTSYASAANASPSHAKSDDFDALMSAFLKDSDDRLTSLKRNTEGKRGGRGGRRS